MGLLHPTDGSICVDDEIITEVSKYGWQSQLAHVPQSIFLIDASISQNIALGIPLEQIDFELVQESARKAQIHDAINSWDDKFYNHTNDRLTSFQAVSASALQLLEHSLMKAAVIIFDEATSALDSKTEHSVMESILSFDKDLTIIIVAHRLSTLKNCSKIIELSDGKILRQGLYDEII